MNQRRIIPGACTGLHQQITTLQCTL